MRVVQWMLGVLLLSLVCGCGGAKSMAMEMNATSPGYRGDMVTEAEGGEADSADSFADAAMPPPQAPMFAQNMPGAAGGAAPPPPPPPPPRPAPPSATDRPPPMGEQPPATSPKRRAVPLLIYTANLNMAVFEATSSIEAVHKMALDSGGYLVRRTDRSITVRVPADKFRGSLEAIGKMGDVLHREENVQDVTDKFYDLRTRLKNARAIRERLQQLLAQSKDVRDALAVEKELGRVTADIEAMEGKLKRLRELIAFSTITVEFRPRPSDRVKSKVKLPFPWLNRLGLSNLLNL